jgi:cytoskeletal protein CcmA (bactofilin family)
MFSKSKINETNARSETDAAASHPQPERVGMSDNTSQPLSGSAKPKPAPSLLSSDLTIIGNLRTSGDVQVEGNIQGDIRAHLLTVGESAKIEGEVVADDVVVTGRVTGKIRGLKVRLTSTARVEGDIIHKTIAIESGAHFEGSVERQEDPLGMGNAAPRTAQAAPRPTQAAPAPQPPHLAAAPAPSAPQQRAAGDARKG